MTTVSWPDIAAHRERLVRVARRRVPTREDAEDVVHEAMLRCATFENLDEARLGQFLTAVTLRLCADVYRHQERATRASRRLVERDEVPGPEEAACEAAEADALRALLATLPERQRDVLVERSLGMSVSQISARHALTYKATESALSRARSTMRVALAAAMSFLGAVVATVRRRPSVALAVPLTALAVVTTVARTPYVDPQPPREVTLKPPMADTVPVARVPSATGPAARTTFGKAARLRTTTNASRPAAAGGKHENEIATIEKGDHKARLYGNGEPALTDDPTQCVFHGGSVSVAIDTSGPVPSYTSDQTCHTS